MAKIYILLLTIVLLLSITTAQITCDKSQITKTIIRGDNATTEKLICSNAVNQSITISKSGDFFSIDENSIGISPATKTITLSFLPNIALGNHFGSVSFSSGLSVPVFFTLNEPTVKKGEIIVFPTSKIVNVKKGESKNQNIQVIVPANYVSPITIQSVSFNPDIDVVAFLDLDLGVINQGQTLNIPFKISALDVELGTYNTEITVLATDANGQITLPKTSLQITVQATVNPVTDTTFSSAPSCSLSSVILNLNNTYSFTCSGVQANLEVNPRYNDLLEGVGVDITSGLYTYKFKPIKNGESEFFASFTYRGAPVFSPFKSQIKVQSGGVSLPGSILSLIFTPKPDIAKHGEEILMQVVDNKTGSLVENPEVYINAIQIAPLNFSTNSFKYIFDSGKNYDIRVRGQGYNDLTLNMKLKEISLEVFFQPDKSSYIKGEKLNVTTNPPDASILFDGSIVQNTILLSADGEHIIKVVKEGFLPAERNVTVRTLVTVKTVSPQDIEWNVGDDVIVELTEPIEWKVYRDDTEILTGTDNLVKFTIEEDGTYTVSVKGSELFSKKIESKSLFWWFNWWYVIGGVLVLSALYFIFFARGSSKDYTSAMFNVGDAK